MQNVTNPQSTLGAPPTWQFGSGSYDISSNWQHFDSTTNSWIPGAPDFEGNEALEFGVIIRSTVPGNPNPSCGGLICYDSCGSEESRDQTPGESTALCDTHLSSKHEYVFHHGVGLDQVVIILELADQDGDGIADNLDLCPTTSDPTNADGQANGLPPGTGDACETRCAATDYWWDTGEGACPFGATDYIVGSGKNKQTYTYCDLGSANFFNYFNPAGTPSWECAQLPQETADCPQAYDPDGPGGSGAGPRVHWKTNRYDISYDWYMYECQ